jgi:hypothetical protein
MSMPAPEPVNPYAAPQIPAGYVQVLEPAAAFPGLWRQGNVLVMHKQAPLPPICLKSGQPATKWLPRNLQWHEPWLALTILIAIPVYIVIALIMTKRARLIIGLTDEWAARRRTRMMIALGIALASVVMAIAGIFLGNLESGNEGWFVLLPLAIVNLILAALYGQYACRLVWPKRITDQYVWVKGVHPSFLDRLPVWPYGVI